MDCMRIVERTEQCMVRAERAAMMRVQEEREVAAKSAAALLKLAVSARLSHSMLICGGLQQYDLINTDDSSEGAITVEVNTFFDDFDDGADPEHDYRTGSTLDSLQNALKLVQAHGLG